MIKFAIFIGGWILGMLTLSKMIFPLLLQSITNQMAVAILIVLLMVSYTVVWGTIIAKRR